MNIRPLTLSLASLLALSASPTCFAFQQCREATQACISGPQVLLFFVLPTLVFLLAACVAKWKIRALWLRVAAIAVLSAAWLSALGLALFILMAFMAPCSSACWYRASIQGATWLSVL